VPGTTAESDVQRFDFAFARSYRGPARVFGIRADRAWVEVGLTQLRARYGPWCVETPLTNVVGVDITGPYRFWKTAGSARLAVTDRGLTFASNGDRGVLILFGTPIPGLEPTGLLKHPELTVTVADTEGLAALLRARCQNVLP
jgi:hypothetical protein